MFACCAITSPVSSPFLPLLSPPQLPTAKLCVGMNWWNALNPAQTHTQINITLEISLEGDISVILPGLIQTNEKKNPTAWQFLHHWTGSGSLWRYLFLPISLLVHKNRSLKYSEYLSMKVVLDAAQCHAARHVLAISDHIHSGMYIKALVESKM